MAHPSVHQQGFDECWIPLTQKRVFVRAAETTKSGQSTLIQKLDLKCTLSKRVGLFFADASSWWISTYTLAANHKGADHFLVLRKERLEEALGYQLLQTISETHKWLWVKNSYPKWKSSTHTQINETELKKLACP